MRSPRLAGLALVALVLITPRAQGETREVATMAEALADVKPGTLVLFDLDNTLIETVQTLGSDQWYDHMVATFTAEARSQGRDAASAKSLAIGRALKLWKQAQRITRVAAVEPSTPRLVRQLQDRGIKVMGLTARPVDLAPATQEQLRSVGIDLARSPVHPRDLELVASRDINNVARYTGGILFSGLNPKGDLLVRLLEHRRVRLRPSGIVFVDDKSGNVASVEGALARLPTPHVSFRYGAADPKVRALRPDLAEVQLRHLGGILSDGAAQVLLAAGTQSEPARPSRRLSE